MGLTIQSIVRSQGFVDFEGVRLNLIPSKLTGRDLEPGDTYVAERNSGPKLLTVKSVNFEGGWVEAQETAYSYDMHECVGVTFE